MREAESVSRDVFLIGGLQVNSSFVQLNPTSMLSGVFAPHGNFFLKKAVFPGAAIAAECLRAK
jgi:hypothetical protein